MNVYVYRKSNEPLSLFQDSLNSVLDSPEDIFKAFTESERGYVALKKLEEETIEGSIWIVRTLGNLGNTIGDIRNELGMLLKRGIVLLIVEFPTMNTYRSKKQSMVLLSLLNEVYTELQGAQIDDIPMHPLKAGRKRQSILKGGKNYIPNGREKI